MPLKGKYWIIPKESDAGIESSVVDTSATEHAIHAKKFLLGLEDGDPETQSLKLFTKLEPEKVEFFRAKGVPGEILNFLRSNADPRWYVIERFNWVRIAQANFNVWKWDYQTVKLILGADDYWKAQTALIFDVLDVLEFSTRKCFSISLRRMQEIKSDQDAFRYLPEKATEE